MWLLAPGIRPNRVRRPPHPHGARPVVTVTALMGVWRGDGRPHNNRTLRPFTRGKVKAPGRRHPRPAPRRMCYTASQVGGRFFGGALMTDDEDEDERELERMWRRAVKKGAELQKEGNVPLGAWQA